MTPPIEAEGLVRRYGDLVAVDGISFKVEPGFKVPFFLSSMMHIEELPLTWS